MQLDRRCVCNLVPDPPPRRYKLLVVYPGGAGGSNGQFIENNTIIILYIHCIPWLDVGAHENNTVRNTLLYLNEI